MIIFFIIASIISWFIYWGVLYLNISWDKNLSIYYSSRNMLINGETLPRFTFKQFKKFYNLNPDSWEIFKESGIFICPAKHIQGSYLISNDFYGVSHSYKPIFFTNMFEYRKYRKWAKKLWRASCANKNSKEINENTKEIINLVQQDIDEVRKNYEKTLSETEDTLAKALKNLRIDSSKHYYVNDKNEIVVSTYYNGVEGEGAATVTLPLNKDKQIKWMDV